MDVAPFDLLAFFSPDDFALGTLHLHSEALGSALELVLDTAFLAAAALSPPGRRVWAALLSRSQARPGAITRIFGADGLAGMLFLALVALGRDVVALPIALWRDWHVERQLGISHEPLGSFLRHLATYALLSAAACGVLGLVLGAVRRRWPRAWWLAVGLVAAPVLVGDAVIEPLRAHLDFQVTPLAAGPLRTRLEALTRAQHAPPSDIVVIDASKYGRRVNAFTTGLGPTRRLVLTDTLLAQGDEAVAGAVAHELGHRRAERLPGRLALACAGLLLFLGLVELLVRIALRLGAPATGPALAFVFAAVTLGSLILLPARNAWSRAEEREADRVELAARRDYDAIIAEEVARARAAAQAPDPPRWWVVWMADHPPPAERIGRALWYKQRAAQARGTEAGPEP